MNKRYLKWLLEIQETKKIDPDYFLLLIRDGWLRSSFLNLQTPEEAAEIYYLPF